MNRHGNSKINFYKTREFPNKSSGSFLQSVHYDSTPPVLSPPLLPPTSQQTENLNIKQFIANQNHLNNLFKTFLEYNLGSNSQTKTISKKQRNELILTISNQTSKQRMKHGKQFKDMLDPRDQILEHDFNFNVKIDIQDIKKKGFLRSRTYKTIIENIHQFMAETLANILSVSFKFLNHSQLEEKQVKNYAASNIMLNLQSIFSQTIDAIKSSQISKQAPLDQKQIKVDLIERMEKIIKDILINEAAYYPQAPITGGTLRMNNVIHEVNRFDDEQNDLIFSNKLKITQCLQVKTINKGQQNQREQLLLEQNQDYTQFIMSVINSAIKVIQDCQGDSQQRVNKEMFTEFNKQLFALSQIQVYKKLFQMAEEKSISLLSRENTRMSIEKNVNHFKQDPILDKPTIKDLEIEKSKKQIDTVNNAICSYFQRITQRNAEQLRTVQRKIKNNSFCSTVNSQREKSLEQLKDYSIGFKIPNYVKPFSRVQITDKHFRAKHSSVLRILTKWAEYLQDIFINAERHIMMRRYPFKDIHNNLINITKQSVKKHIIKRLNEEHVEVNIKLEKIKDRNFELVSQIVSRGKGSLPHNIYRFTQTREVSSKINAVLTSLMVEYLSVLIHHLLKAGTNITESEGSNAQVFVGNINLVVFKVSDLMRAKFKCSESSFIALLKTMHLLDESKAMKGKFKLVRIKNKLEDPANNILINYLFMGKVLCQLQLSIQESQGKEKNYYIFSHFIYELTRGSFGVISQCAIIVSQLDPIASSCEELYYEQKYQKFKQKKEKNGQKYDEKVKQKKKSQKDENIFYCAKCQKLIIKEDTKLFQQMQGGKRCIKCLFSEKQIQKKINKKFFEHKELLLEWLKEGKIKRITNYAQLGKETRPFIRISPAAKIQFVFVIQQLNELKHFVVKVNLDSLGKNRSEEVKIDFSEEGDYINIQKWIKNHKQLNDHFLFKTTDKQTVSKFLKIIQSQPDIFQKQVKSVLDTFNSFRIEKNLIKSIKSKAQIINFNSGKEEWKFFQKLWQVYSIKDNAKRQQQINTLKYRKFKRLEFNKIKVIEACNGIAFNDNLGIPKCNNLQLLKLQHNDQLLNVNFLNYLTSINVLNLSQNNLNNLDGLKNLTTINSLNLYSNKLKTVDGLKNIQNIEHLNIAMNQLQDISALQNIKAIDTLDLSDNLIESIDGLRNITKITKLFLNNNKIKNADVLINIVQIETLNLSFNQLESIDFLKNLRQIKYLQLQHNKITNINALQKLTQMNTLNLQDNQLENVDGLKNFTSFYILNLMKNKINNIDGLRNIHAAGSIYLSSNKLTNIDALSKINFLKQLYLENNSQLEITCLPVNLNELKADYLQLANFDFQTLRSLQRLVTNQTEQKLFKNLGLKVQIQQI